MTNANAFSKATTDKGGERIAMILEDAKNIVVEEGFSALSFRAIAKRTGMTVGNVSYYFASKEQLMEQLAEYIFDRWEKRFRKSIPVDAGDKMGIFLYAIRYMIEENKRPRSRSLLLEMWAMANQSSAIAKMMDIFYARMRAQIEDMIFDINPGLPKQACQLRAALIAAQIEGLMVVAAPKRLARGELKGIDDVALEQVTRLALS
ncbi:TetR/AcrR family transcriptional regulator [Methyloferula stellata]|uniref:TetR/AcrR family transcriptional regulator n=1 Tax=Methyloferula stellata TaxID=876270 RepID=UPI0003659935|nr:TetR/AcrR family transcriptional regulator [Methyloferula stellata]